MTIAPGWRLKTHSRFAGATSFAVVAPSRTITSVPAAARDTNSDSLPGKSRTSTVTVLIAPPSRVQLDRLDDLVEVVRHLHGPVGERHPLHPALAQVLVERPRVTG